MKITLGRGGARMRIREEDLLELNEMARRCGGGMLGALLVKPTGAPDEECHFTKLTGDIGLKRDWDAANADESLDVVGVSYGNPVNRALVYIDVEDPDLYDIEWCARHAMRQRRLDIDLSEYMALPEDRRSKKPDRWMQPVSAKEPSGEE